MAKLNQLNFGSEDLVAWCPEPSGWLADRLEGLLEGLRLNFLWSAVRK